MNTREVHPITIHIVVWEKGLTSTVRKTTWKSEVLLGLAMILRFIQFYCLLLMKKFIRQN